MIQRQDHFSLFCGVLAFRCRVDDLSFFLTRCFNRYLARYRCFDRFRVGLIMSADVVGHCSVTVFRLHPGEVYKRPVMSFLFDRQNDGLRLCRKSFILEIIRYPRLASFVRTGRKDQRRAGRTNRLRLRMRRIMCADSCRRNRAVILCPYVRRRAPIMRVRIDLKLHGLGLYCECTVVEVIRRPRLASLYRAGCRRLCRHGRLCRLRLRMRRIMCADSCRRYRAVVRCPYIRGLAPGVARCRNNNRSQSLRFRISV